MKSCNVKFVCPVCGQHFATSARYIEHVLLHGAQDFAIALMATVLLILLAALPMQASTPVLTFTDNTFEVVCDDDSMRVSVEVTFSDGAVQLIESQCNQKVMVGAMILVARIVGLVSSPNAVYQVFLPEVSNG